MAKEDIAPEVVHKKIIGIRKKGKKKVYCLSSPRFKNFIANSMVVGNCDALRYALFNHSYGDDSQMTLEDANRLERRYRPLY